MSTGRPPEVGVARDVQLRVRFSKPEAAEMDEARNHGESRSDFVRVAVKNEAKARRS